MNESSDQTMFDQAAEKVGDMTEQIERVSTAAVLQRREPEAAALPTMDPESLISKAIEHQVPVESLERLMDLRERIKNEKAREAFNQALASFQAECPIIAKTKVIPDKQGNERSRYAPLENIVSQVKELLLLYGLSYSFDSEIANTETPAVKAVCTIHHTAGHSESSSFTAHLDKEARMNTPQRDASAQTYAKRYAFMNALGILTSGEDDDGRGAGPAPEAKPQQDERAPQAPTRQQRKRSDAIEPEMRDRIRKAYQVWQADHQGEDFNAFAWWAGEIAGTDADLSRAEAWTEKVLGEVEQQLSRKQD